MTLHSAMLDDHQNHHNARTRCRPMTTSSA
jgi:hypothetical protein